LADDDQYQPPIILDRSPVQAAFDDPAAERREIRLEELVQALGEQRMKLLRTRIVGFFPHLGLAVDMQEARRHAAAFDVQLLRDVAQEQATRSFDLVGAELGAAARARYSRAIHWGMKPTRHAPMCWLGHRM
jgi:hypothetical protein